MKIISAILVSLLSICCNAQDSILTNKELAEKQIVQLHDGYLVVRLKTYDKTIAAYRRQGNNKLANKLEQQYRAANLYLMKAFLENFTFCRVLFIKAEDSRKLVARQPNIFLNGRLETDSSVKLDNRPFFVAENGTLMSNDRVSDKSFKVKHSEVNAFPSTSAALVISDTTLTQLKEPFPFFEVLDASDYFMQAGGPGRKKRVALADSIHEQGAKAASETKDSLAAFSRKTMYHWSVWRLNKGLIKYYAKISKNHGKEVSDDPFDWEPHNPNKNQADKIKIIDLELSKLIDDSKFQAK